MKWLTLAGRVGSIELLGSEGCGGATAVATLIELIAFFRVVSSAHDSEIVEIIGTALGKSNDVVDCEIVHRRASELLAPVSVSVYEGEHQLSSSRIEVGTSPADKLPLHFLGMRGPLLSAYVLEGLIDSHEV